MCLTANCYQPSASKSCGIPSSLLATSKAMLRFSMWWDDCGALKPMKLGQWAWIRTLNTRPLRYELAHTKKPIHQIHTRVQIYVNNKLSDVIPVNSWMLTPEHPLVLCWHHNRSASFADFFSLLSLFSSCQHKHHVHCHDLRNRTTEYHLNMRAHTYTHTHPPPLEVSAHHAHLPNHPHIP